MPDITVTFANGQFSFSPNVLNTRFGLNKITLSLLPIPGLQWAHPPVTWTDPENPPCMTPDPYVVGSYAIITDENSAPGQYGFVVNVLYNGEKFTSPDPTILNKEITSTGGGGTGSGGEY